MTRRKTIAIITFSLLQAVLIKKTLRTVKLICINFKTYYYNNKQFVTSIYYLFSLCLLKTDKTENDCYNNIKAISASKTEKMSNSSHLSNKRVYLLDEQGGILSRDYILQRQENLNKRHTIIQSSTNPKGLYLACYQYLV